MKPRSFFLVLITAVVVFLGLTGWGLAIALARSPLPLVKGGVDRVPVTAALIPGQSPIMVSLLVNPDRLEAFTQLAVNPNRRRRSHQELQDLEQSLLAKTGLDYRREVKPWLGEEVSLAVTDLDYDQDPTNGAQPGYLLVVHSKDPELSREFLQLSYSTAAIAGNADLVFDQYQGVKITYKRPLRPVGNGNLLASAVVGNYVIFANHPQVLRQSLNSLQAPSLALPQQAAYQGALTSLQTPRLGLFYANFPALSAWLSQRSQPENGAIDQTLTVALSLQAQGLVARTAFTGLHSPIAPIALTETIPTPDLVPLPVDSGLVITGENLAQQWQQLATGLVPQSPLQQSLSQWITDWQTPLGLDLANDIFAWVKDAYQLMLIPQDGSPATDWVFVARNRDPDRTQAALDHLDQLAIAQGYQLSAIMMGDQPVTAWTSLKTIAQQKIASLETQVRGVHAQVGDNVILASSLESLSTVLADHPPVTLADQPQFAQAMATLPDNQYVYLDWQRSEPFLVKQLPVLRVLELSLKPLFKNLRSLTLHADGGTPTVQNGTIYINLGVPQRS
ncbi:MAG: DUF3352 domain-containing protein [Synechocystis sp.]|nr:DUF3352 domain-containing protein [Synechocystis sp.]